MTFLCSLTMALALSGPGATPSAVIVEPGLQPMTADEQVQDSQKKAATQLEELDEQPEAIKRASPVYPESAKKDTLEGTVFLRVVIGENGGVKEVHVDKGVRNDLDTAAVNAMKQWIFKPPMKKGKPVVATVVVPFKFKLADKTK